MYFSVGKYGVGVYSESRSLLGENILSSGVFNWTPGHIELLQYALDGELRNRSLVKGYLDNANYASALSGRVPQAVKSIYDQERSELQSVFCGPIYDNSNASILRIPIGRCASHQELYDMTWTVKGVTHLGNYKPMVREIQIFHLVF
jgi:hypothetical protein